MPTALSTDLYELTMAAGYFQGGAAGRASFELFVRDLPAGRGYLVAAGLDQALGYLETLRFTPDEIAYLRTVPGLAREMGGALQVGDHLCGPERAHVLWRTVLLQRPLEARQRPAIGL